MKQDLLEAVNEFAFKYKNIRHQLDKLGESLNKSCPTYVTSQFISKLQPHIARPLVLRESLPRTNPLMLNYHAPLGNKPYLAYQLSPTRVVHSKSATSFGRLLSLLEGSFLSLSLDSCCSVSLISRSHADRVASKCPQLKYQSLERPVAVSVADAKAQLQAFGNNGNSHTVEQCVVPENIHTPPPTDGQWKFLGGGGG